MPGLVHYSEITNLKSFDAGTTQVLKTCSFNGHEWFFKQPPALIVDPRARTLRILNEAICGAIVLFLSQHTEKKFLTPLHLLVVDPAGTPMGVLSQEIDYDPFTNQGTGKKGFQIALNEGLAELSTVRFCMEDPDGIDNSGYDTKTKLSSIDYGLANYLYLLTQNALTECEKGRLPLPRGADAFKVTVDNILSFILEPMGMDIGFLVHHVFWKFEEHLAEFCETDEPLVERFFSQTYKILHLFSKELTAKTFKERIFATLGLDALNKEEQVLSHHIMDALIQRASDLKTTLQTLSKCSADDFKRLAAEGAPDKRFTPVMLSASPSYTRRVQIDGINELMRQRAETESAISARGITPANGGGAEGYPGVLFPRRRTLGSFDATGAMSPPMFSMSPAMSPAVSPPMSPIFSCTLPKGL